MFYSTALTAALVAFSSFATAQNETEPTGSDTYFYGDDGSLQIDPNTVELVLRQSWCRGQTNNCPIICGGVASQNTCDSNTLEFECECQNGNQPNITDFDATMPSYICQEWRSLCVEDHPDDLEGQSGCESITCGDRAVAELSEGDNSAATTSSAAETTTSTSTATSAGTSSTGSTSGSSSDDSDDADSEATTDDSDDSDSADSGAMDLAMNYGTGALAAGIFGLFAFAL
ncbi:hypothetical protein MBLNU230_g6089t1 [Neophaeotheca triangularis]